MDDSKIDKTVWTALFKEDFDVLQDGLPANWQVERNSNLPITAWEGHDGSFDLLSAGNKYIPVIPDVRDFCVEMTFSANYRVSMKFSFTLHFHYDLFRREGDAVRITCHGESVQCTVEFGRVADNIFTPLQTFTHDGLSIEKVLGSMSVKLTCVGGFAQVSFAGLEDSFYFGDARRGKVGLSREHFLDLFNVSGFTISVPDMPKCLCANKIHLTLPQEAMPYPIHCELMLEDYGDCVFGEVRLSGGVRETPAGEGDYHGMRVDILTNPFIKVISDGKTMKYTLFQGDTIFAQDEMTPSYFYALLYRRPQWPMKRRIAFIKPKGELFFAVGADTCLNTTTATTALSPGETLCDDKGNLIYSGKAISEADCSIVFKSQEEKEIIARLPKDDPRYERAVEFARRNHYFLANEPISFTIYIISRKALPMDYDVALEDVFLREIGKVAYDASFSESKVANFTVHTAVLRCRGIDVSEGVYHLRVRGMDLTAVPVEDYCAFEVMGREEDAIPPPLVSGLPFLYDSRTETRGLETDSFDPWHLARSVDEGHYMACANFLPAAAREFKVAPTLRAYRREWFLWLASRCSNAPLMRENCDLIAQADYISNKEELGNVPLYSRSNYGGGRLQNLLEFIRQHPDERYDYDNIRDLEKAVAEGRGVDSVSTSVIINGGYGPDDPELNEHNFTVLATHHWHEWLEFRSRYMAEILRKSVEEMRRLQPKIKYAAYGPANIYCAVYKGQEFVSVHQSEYFSDDIVGFFQYEDYPYSCSYPIVRGTYMLASALMVLPFARIYPEYYTKSIQGCPDGAVYYAHPPFGLSNSNAARRFKLCAFDYAFASGHFLDGEFRYWSKYGFQVCKFTREYYEQLLRTWRHVVEHRPVRPLKSAAFVFNRHACGTVKIIFTSIMRHVRETAFEDVPFAYEMSRLGGQLAGFQINIEELVRLTPDDTDLLVLPPLTNASQEALEAIRTLHSAGVNLLAFEDVTGLEDIFGVRPLEKPQAVTVLHSTDMLPFNLSEFCEEPLCKGKYASDGAEVLIDAEAPVLLSKSNGSAKAVLCNVPPTLVRDCQLHQRDSFSRDSISELMNRAITFVMGEMTGSAAKTSEGRIIGFKDASGSTVLVVQNNDENATIYPEVRYSKQSPSEHAAECNQPLRLVDDNDGELILRLSIPPENAAILTIKNA